MNNSYKECFFNNGIIKALKTADSEKFNEIFGADYNAELADDFICFSNGKYIVNDMTLELIKENQGINKLALMLWSVYYNSWKSCLKTLSVDFTKGYEETTTRNKTDTKTTDISINSKSQIFAYDSETASNDAMNDNVNNTSDSGSEDETVTKSGYNYNASLFDMLAKYNAFQVENVFLDIVKQDIIETTCIIVY